MTELEIKIIRFLLSSAVYSENAIIKNLGIDKDTLNKSFKILEENGYLESYEDFIKRENLNEEIFVLATGGLGKILSAEIDEIDEYDPNLSLKGLYTLYKLNK